MPRESRGGGVSEVSKVYWGDHCELLHHLVGVSWVIPLLHHRTCLSPLPISFPVTSQLHGSVGTGSMGTGFVWLDRSKCGGERVGREEEGTSSGRTEMGAYVAILRNTPDHEDLLTAKDSEVLCRLVGRWVGQGGKSSLSNTADDNILEYILAKLESRIAIQARTFLVC